MNQVRITACRCLLLCTLSASLPHASAAEDAPAPDSDRRPAVATLADLWDGKALWVADAEKIGGHFNFHFVSFLRDGDELWAYYIHNHPGTDGKLKQAVGRARSKDGLTWTDGGIVLDVGPAAHPATQDTPSTRGAWDDRIASYPGIWKDGDTYYLVYEGAAEDIGFSPGEIGLATSKDGKTFVKHPDNPILRRDASPTRFERGNIGTPSLYKEGGTWYLFYHGYDNTVCQIAVASGPDLTKLTKSRANPILPVSPGATSAWDTGTTGKRSTIVKEGDYYYMAFEGSTLPPFTFAKWSSGLARTRTLAEGWTKRPANPMLPQTAVGLGNDGPELLRFGDQWYLYVRTPDTNVTNRFRLEPKRATATP